MSRALATLRAAFDDPLLVRAGRGMVLTPLAESLQTPLERALAAVDRLGATGDFHPATDERLFRMIVPDIAGSFLIAPLVQRVSQAAPQVRLHVSGTEGDALQALVHDQVDLVVGAMTFEHPELYVRRVGVGTTWSVVVGAHAPSGEIGLDAWLAAKHVQITPAHRPDLPSRLDAWLERQGLKRTIAVKLGYVSAAAAILECTAYMLTLPTPMAREVHRHHGLRLQPHPLSRDLEALQLRMTWHQVHHRDAGHAWLRAMVAETVEQQTHAFAG